MDIIKTVTVIRKREVARDIFEVTFVYDSHYRQPHPGQYLSLRMGSVWRSFTAIKGPSDGTMRLIVRLVPHTVTKLFFDESVVVGAALEIQDSQGDMIKVVDNDCVLVATGTGIIPVVEIARHALRSNRRYTLDIIFGIRDRESMFYEQELRDLQQEFLNCRVTIVASGDYGPDFSYKGRVDEYITSHIDEMRKSDFYICGRSDIVTSIMESLDNLDVPRVRQHQI